ncbi:aspartate aminotransferase [Erysipelothrix larvae]|uniref:Aminotransferase n=1 Tax=Erysipelothrix larvae TaxID=1514105 RepID=A0A0X8GYR9_9FIRM|nr:pyridoxal phosphate-dependent aminotransferase [Erysipelothrix larvae]AMC92892.1 aspartate aminotransferase [Erysipelothrix larvae]
MKTRIDTIELSGIRAFSEYCQQFEDIVFLTIGEPDFDTPQVIKDALIRSVSNNETHYPPAIGLTSLREKIAAYENTHFSDSFTKENVIVTAGATEGLTLGMWTTLQAGDEIIVPTPCFALYFSQAELCGAKAVSLYNADHNFQITPQMLEDVVSDKTRAILLTSPNNPTGAVLDQASLDAVCDFAKKYDLKILLDDVYRSFIYEGDCPSIRSRADMKDRLIIIQSFSKSHAMTGWRLGYLIADEALISNMHKLHQNLVTGIPTFVQKAVEEAMDLDLTYMQDDYKVRRDYVVERLNKMGLSVEAPKGAFYIFPNITKYDSDSLAFAKRILKEAKIAMIPGIYFGQDGYLRISYCYSMDVLKEAMDRLERFMNTLNQ